MHPMEVLHEIEGTTSRTYKKEWLKKLDSRILFWAYSPHKRFYMTAPDVRGLGDLRISDQTYHLLGLLSNRKLSGHSAYRTVQAYMLGLAEPDAELLRRILNKDLRCGIGIKTINDVFPDLIPEAAVMLAWPYREDKLFLPCWVDVKIDGIRADYDSGFFFSRSGKLLHGYDHVAKEIQKLGINYPLTGEFRDASKSFEKSSGMSRRSKNTAGKQEKFYIIDAVLPGVPANARYAKLDFIPTGEYIEPIKKLLVHSKDHIGVLYEWARNNKYEGIMVKRYGHLYVAGRSYDWMKLKPEHAVDLEVLKLLPGTGKYTGSLGKVVVEYNTRIVKVTPAIKDDLRQYYWDNPNELLGKTIEVLFQEETSKGSLRHPRFKVVRKDK